MTAHSDDRPLLKLDRLDESVHQGESRLKLTPKAFAVLRQLMEHPGRLVTKDALLAAVWPDAVVTDASVATCIREIRRALGDNPVAPLYIQTVHRRGYRYTGEPAQPPIDDKRPRGRRDSLLVGRDRELAHLSRLLDETKRGARRLIFLDGEPGIGKTALVDAFVNRAANGDRVLVARGQCVEQYGATEPYLPWLEMLNQLAHEYGEGRLSTLLRRYAPMWLAQMPWLLRSAERETLQREIAGTTRDRMVRELAEALEALSAETPIVIVFEDLHWSDQSSALLLSYVARRHPPARLLVIGTYRPAEMIASRSPLATIKQDLQLHGLCDDLPLPFLSASAVVDYVAARLPGAPRSLAERIHQRTDGNPLFMISVIEYFLARGALVQDGHGWQLRQGTSETDMEVPETLQEMIERRIDRLSPAEQLVLEAASVAGVAFCGATVAAALQEPAEAVEERLSALSRTDSFVRRRERVAWPDGTQTDGYTFVHALYQNVLYDRIGSTRRIRMHRQIAEHLEAGFGDRASEVAAELALHFQRGRDAERALRYLAEAGESAIRRNAFVEAIAVLSGGLDLLSTLPEGRSRDARELPLRVPLGVAYMNNRGYASQEAGDTFRRAYDLCRRGSDASHLFRVLRGLWSFAVLRGDLQTSQSVAQELLLVAGREGDRSGLVEGHRIVATNWFHLGNFSSARDHLEQGIALYDPKHHSAHAYLFGQDPGVSCLSWLGMTLWHLGHADDAVASSTKAIELARRIGHPFSLAYAMNFRALVHQLRDEPDAAAEHAREGVRHAREQGLTQMLAMGQILHGWAVAFLGRGEDGLDELRRGAELWRSNGSRLVCPHWSSLLASALHETGQPEEAMQVLDDALAEMESVEERWFESTSCSLKAALLTARAGATMDQATRAEAERWLLRALAVADRQSASLPRARAAATLNRLRSETPFSRASL